MKFAYITSISPGYMFAQNVNNTANAYYGTNADVHLLYDQMEPEYMEACENSFQFKVVWVPKEGISSCYHNVKYNYAQRLVGEYDAICFIDSDLFICCDTTEHFERAARENVLITATHMWSGGNPDGFDWGNPSKIIDRGLCQFADFPIFINPKFGLEFFKDWVHNTTGDLPGEHKHPLVAFNRALCTHFSKDQVIPLNGEQWVCDQNYWDFDYEWDNEKKIMKNNNGRVYAIHNKWWKLGRDSGEWLGHRFVPLENEHMQFRLDRGEKNFNTIRKAMEEFNEMVPTTKRTDYFSGPSNRRAYLKQWFQEHPEEKNPGY